MANLISLNVFTQSEDPNEAGIYTSAAEVISVSRIQGVVANTVTSGVQSAIDYSYNVGNLFQSKTILASATPAAVVTASNAALV
jgi:hypothetical protein